ncbi:hypothetical protein PG997_010474 [Apiospora hydei]|uniref:Uncharacterized protein n=1 Tax=Apiospora hydei TaxID=1337664 RepID=A0ABR1VX30_9PEZI
MDALPLQPGDIGRPRSIHGDATGRRRVSLGQDVFERRLVHTLSIAHNKGVASSERLVERRVVRPGELVGGEVHVPTDHGDPRRRPGRRLACCSLEMLIVGNVHVGKWGRVVCGRTTQTVTSVTASAADGRFRGDRRSK